MSAHYTFRTARTSNVERPVLVSGIQPSGKLHIGNYLGALKNFVDLQNSGRYHCHFFIADLHSLTEPFNPKEKRGQVLELAADFLAAGLDPKKSTIFLQSAIPAHSELTWILNCLTPIGELRRMTQFKEKSHGGEGGNVGLFDYPVLMAADVLLYGAEFVPVGEDQLQHLELARTLARKFNSRFGDTLVEPQPLLTQNPRVMSLLDPRKKMSKSHLETCLFLDDSPEEIKTKLQRAVTDSGSEVRFDPEKKPGISNLLEIYAGLSGKPMHEIEYYFVGKNYGQFKTELAELVVASLADFRKKKQTFLKKPRTLVSIFNTGSKKAGGVAAKKITEVKERVGIAL